MEINTKDNTKNNEQTPPEKPKNVNSGLISLEIVARMNNIDIDMRAIVREYGINSAYTEPEEIIRIAKNKVFKVKKKRMALEDYSEKYPLPAILQLKDDSYIVLLALKPDEDMVLTLTPLEGSPKSHKTQELQAQLKDEIIILRHKNALNDVKFGFKWFFNEIFKYKKIIGDEN